MAYIDSKQVKQMRDELKKMFATKLGWKLSIINEHNTNIHVYIMEAPIDLSVDCPHNDPEHFSINTYNTNKYIHKIIYDGIINIINKGNYDNSDILTDYFDVGWYINIYVGKWDKPFTYRNNTNQIQSIIEPHMKEDINCPCKA